MTLDLTDAETRALLNLFQDHATLWVFALNWETIDAMARDTALALHALTYVIGFMRISRQSMARPHSVRKIRRSISSLPTRI